MKQRILTGAGEVRLKAQVSGAGEDVSSFIVHPGTSTAGAIIKDARPVSPQFFRMNGINDDYVIRIS